MRTVNKPETDKELRHTDLYIEEQYLGYVIKNDSMAARVGENWNYVSRHEATKHCYGKTKKEVINMVRQQLGLS